MNARGAVDPSFEGILTNDDNVLAVNIAGEANAHPDTFAVVQGAIIGVDAQLNPVTQDKQYLRAGMSTAKTGTQRTFKATGDRYIGDDFQDFALSRDVAYGVGEIVVVDYVWFCILNGKGEKGRVAIVVNSDGSGNAGETAAVDIDLRKTGDMPVDYTYASTGGAPVGALTVVSVAGTLAGDTAVYVNPALGAGNSYVTKLDETLPTLPALDTVLSAGWDPWDGTADITAATGTYVSVVEIDASDKAKKGGIALVTAAE